MVEESQVVSLRDDFYRDRTGQVMLLLACTLITILFLGAISLFLYLDQPPPIAFVVDKDWRVQADVPVDKPYLSDNDVLQWVSDALRRSFVFDFYHYSDQLKKSERYFTPSGWKVFLNQLNIYVNYNNVQAGKLFVNGTPSQAPFIQNRGVLYGRYVWWVQLPINISYTGNDTNIPSKNLTLQVLVVRVPTLNNLHGVAIENLIVANSSNPGIQ